MKRCVLITNLGSVEIGDVRLMSRALLLQDNGDDKRGPRYRVRGFGTTAGDEQFMMVLPSIDYVFGITPLPEWMTAAGAVSLSMHGTLRVIDVNPSPAQMLVEERSDTDVRIGLGCGSADGRPIDFETFDEPNTMRLWARLHEKVLTYWHAPFVMLPVQSTIDHARMLARIGRA